MNEPTVLMGDLNAGPPEPSLDPIEALLRDVWLPAGTGEGLTAFVDEDALTRRIDYVWCRTTSRPPTSTWRLTVTTLASDHYPVVADLTVPGRRSGSGRRGK